MPARKQLYPPGWWFQGDYLKADDELRFEVTDNPEIDSSGGPFKHYTRGADLESYKIINKLTGEDIFKINTVGKEVEVVAPYVLNAPGMSGNIVAATLSSWTLDAGTIYYADIVHNFASDDILIEIFDSITKETVLVEKIDRIDTNTVRIFIEGNTASLRVVVINANPVFIGSSGRNGVTNPTTPYTAQNNDVIVWDVTSGDKVLDLPPVATSNNFRIDVKRIGVVGNKLIVNPNGAELIEGGTSAELLDDGEGLSLFCNGAAWYILASI